MTTVSPNPPLVYQKICEVMLELSKEGISKSRKNTQQGYQFRGIDDVYNALAPVLAKHRLCVLPKVISRNVTEQQSKSGGVLFYVVLDVEFYFVCADDASQHVVRAMGEAMDSGDKATNKAMSAAYKYACMQAFCIPTEGDNDADAQTHQVVRSVKDNSGKLDTSGVNPEGVKRALKDFRDAMADRNDEKVLRIHEDLLDEPEVYQAVTNELTPKERANIRDAVVNARQARADAKVPF